MMLRWVAETDVTVVQLLYDVTVTSAAVTRHTSCSGWTG